MQAGFCMYTVHNSIVWLVRQVFVRTACNIKSSIKCLFLIKEKVLPQQSNKNWTNVAADDKLFVKFFKKIIPTHSKNLPITVLTRT